MGSPGRRNPGFRAIPANSPTVSSATGRPWSLTTLREKLIKIGAKVVHHTRAVTFQLAEVAVPRALFAAILVRIGRLRAAPSPV